MCIFPKLTVSRSPLSYPGEAATLVENVAAGDGSAAVVSTEAAALMTAATNADGTAMLTAAGGQVATTLALQGMFFLIHIFIL